MTQTITPTNRLTTSGRHSMESESVDEYWARYNYHAAKRRERYRRGRIKNGLRKLLFGQNPNCADCGQSLQTVDSGQETYACVIGIEDAALVCLTCAQARNRKQNAVEVPAC